MWLLLEQMLNGVQLGVMLFLMAAGLTLVFGIMNLINLAHGSFYMIGAFVAATLSNLTGSFVMGLLAALLVTALVGILVEILTLRTLYERDHLDQILVSFGLILLFNEAVQVIWGRSALFFDVPPLFSQAVEILPGVPYPSYRLAIIAVGIAVAVFLYILINHTRLGMQIRAGASNRDMIGALGVNIKLLYTLVFGLGTLLAGLAGAMAGPIMSVEAGMGENILIMVFVVVVIGGVGSVRGALAGALVVGIVDTLGRAFLPTFFRLFMSTPSADGMGSALASVSIYLLMAIVLIWRPSGLFHANA